MNKKWEDRLLAACAVLGGIVGIAGVFVLAAGLILGQSFILLWAINVVFSVGIEYSLINLGATAILLWFLFSLVGR